LGFGHESGECRVSDEKALDMRKQREELLNKYAPKPTSTGYQQPSTGYQQPKSGYPQPKVTFSDQTQSDLMKDIFGSTDGGN
jgi:hypothetical protein